MDAAERLLRRWLDEPFSNDLDAQTRIYLSSIETKDNAELGAGDADYYSRAAIESKLSRDQAIDFCNSPEAAEQLKMVMVPRKRLEAWQTAMPVLAAMLHKITPGADQIALDMSNEIMTILSIESKEGAAGLLAEFDALAETDGERAWREEREGKTTATPAPTVQSETPIADKLSGMCRLSGYERDARYAKAVCEVADLERLVAQREERIKK